METAEDVVGFWDDLKKQEQKAKDVQKVVDQQADEQRKQVDAAEH